MKSHLMSFKNLGKKTFSFSKVKAPEHVLESENDIRKQLLIMQYKNIPQ